MSLRVLLVGNGGREHTLAWRLAQSPLVETIYAVPGNGGTQLCPKVTNVTDVSPSDFPGLVRFAQEHQVGLAVPGPEAPLIAGIEGHFRAAGIPVFGPSEAAARMEGSKTFSKDFMKRHNIPTAAYENFDDYEKARAYVDAVDHDIVIKASGIAAGKGVILPATKDEAHTALREIMVDKAFGASGDEVVIEECLLGDELSILTFSDGYTFKSLPPAQDHKRIFDGDEGPNTGGMGCYAPTKIATPELLEKIDREVLAPTFRGFRQERTPFVGLLFTGLMVRDGQVKVLEYNVRFGDPETQTVLPLLSQDSDLAEVMLACAGGYLDAVDFRVEQDQFSATVVAAAGGYPGKYATGTPMTIQALSPPAAEYTRLFHAGTKLNAAGQQQELVTAGGRVIAANATATSLEEAVERAYAGIRHISFDGMHYRKDIAHRAFRDKPPGDQKTDGGLTYSGAGVSIDAGNAFVERIKKAVASTRRAGADAEIGGFGGELDLSQCGFAGAPILVGAIDGVGTKLMIAQAMGKHDTVGIDLVAMNVNDLVVQGAEPLMFLDYYGCSKLNASVAADFVEGVAEGCRQAGCALVGGETAEMPGMYQADDYDAAGAAIGVVTQTARLPRLEAMTEGDVLLGLASHGVHSNGFSLVRKIVERSGLSYHDAVPYAEKPGVTSLGESLLTPTRIYVRSLLSAYERGLVKGAAHITGGGLTENVPRMLPADGRLQAVLDARQWPRPPVFQWLRQAGGVAVDEMCRTFNCGVGMVLVVAEGRADEAAECLQAAGETVYRIGKLTAGSTGPACVLESLDSW